MSDEQKFLSASGIFDPHVSDYRTAARNEAPVAASLRISTAGPKEDNLIPPFLKAPPDPNSFEAFRDIFELAAKENSRALDAVRLVHSARRKDYGNPVSNFEDIAAIANTILPRRFGIEVTPAICAYILIALKLARMKHNPTPDSFSDLCGYVDVLYKIQQATEDEGPGEWV